MAADPEPSLASVKPVLQDVGDLPRSRNAHAEARQFAVPDETLASVSGEG